MNIADDISRAWDDGFVAGVLAIASEQELDELDVALFLSEFNIKFDKISEPRRTWMMNMFEEHGLA